ncbi:MAG: F0F1-type synthase beta subunit-like protein [Paenibacillus sp.]|jgi:F-type H+-transporting ATPase subunit beta|nr:F0F1-type synthase beta subunit-like protein [Paenibacillus sp.]
MHEDLQLNVPLLRRRVPSLTTAARAAGLRPATVSNLCTGKTPVGNAEVKTLVILASLAGCSVDELIIRGGQLSMIESGIKAIDLLAPIVRGGTLGLVGRTGSGQLVMLAELCNRMKRRGYATIFWKPVHEVNGIGNVTDAAEYTFTDSSEVYEHIAAFRNERDVFLGVDRTVVLSGELSTLRNRLEQIGTRPLTTAIVDILFEAVDEETPYGPLDTFLKFDLELSTRALFPAVDPVFSTSTMLEGALLEASHQTVQQRARKLLRRFRELRPLVNARGLDILVNSDLLSYIRGERLEAFLTQPFYVTEAFTQKNGEWVSLQHTLDGVRRILDGAADQKDVQHLLYTGRFVSEEAD